ncbi:hypothetical protein GCM10026982_35680 [Nocardiopsis aegyptia]
MLSEALDEDCSAAGTAVTAERIHGHRGTVPHRPARVGDPTGWAPAPGARPVPAERAPGRPRHGRERPPLLGQVHNTGGPVWGNGDIVAPCRAPDHGGVGRGATTSPTCPTPSPHRSAEAPISLVSGPVRRAVPRGSAARSRTTKEYT